MEEVVGVNNYMKKLLIVLFCVFLAFVSWLIMDINSPVSNLLSVNLITFVGILHYPVMAILIILRLPREIEFITALILIFLQWWLTIYLAYRIYLKLKGIFKQ
jgi:hypothetical protein